MAYDEFLAQRIRQRLARRKGIEAKKMFGSVGFLLHGNMCVGVWKDSLLVRLDAEEVEQALREDHVKPFNISGRPSKGWVLVAPGGLADDGRLHDWIARALKYVARLPAK